MTRCAPRATASPGPSSSSAKTAKSSTARLALLLPKSSSPRSNPPTTDFSTNDLGNAVPLGTALFVDFSKRQQYFIFETSSLRHAFHRSHRRLDLKGRKHDDRGRNSD